MKRALAYITAPWGANEFENTENAARYCRLVYDAGFSPVCPLLFLPIFLKDEIPQEHKDGIDMARDYLRRAHVLVVCGDAVDETVKNDIANLLKYFPEQLEANKGFIKGLQADMETLAAHPHPEDGFIGMEVRGDTLTDKENAGAALLDACKEVKTTDPVQIGSYRGFAMSVSFNTFEKTYEVSLRGQMTHRAILGTDPRGNLTRIDNALAQMPERLTSVQAQLENMYQQQKAAQAEVGKPFSNEEELRVKTARLTELDSLLNMDGHRTQPEAAIAKSSRPSVLDKLKAVPVSNTPGKTPKKEMEVR